MPSRIQGITVEVGGDTTKLSKALQGVNKDIKSTQTQLKDVEKLLKLDPSNTELVRQKQQLLAQAIKDTKEKLATLKTAAEQANAPARDPGDGAAAEILGVPGIYHQRDPCQDRRGGRQIPTGRREDLLCGKDPDHPCDGSHRGARYGGGEDCCGF